ncbi:hypothetical protein EPI10_023387 [Gossypium australe]|uniref:Uncharacterized protein n=1 Tax=Gossypium australe TaxID=47621 RepID=A0A5B6VUX7_9ROSI|nr:hypothetical protein EPI10_023387 [Gossypium australe]
MLIKLWPRLSLGQCLSLWNKSILSIEVGILFSGLVRTEVGRGTSEESGCQTRKDLTWKRRLSP